MEKINLYISKKNQKYFKNENVNKKISNFLSKKSSKLFLKSATKV